MTPTRRAAFLALLLAAPRLLPAQSIWISPLASRAEVGLEWIRPSFNDNTAFGKSRGIWVASGRFRVGEHGAIQVAVPRLVAGGVSSFGNPYIGYQSSEPDGKSSFVLGVRLPYASTTYGADQFLAIEGDFDRYEEATPKVITVHAEGQERVWHDSAGADVQVRAGFTGFRSTDASYSSSTTFLFDYGVRFGHAWSRLDLGAALTGRMVMSGSGGNILERNIDQATVELAWRGRVTPRIGFRLPVDAQAKSFYKSALTLGLTVPVQ